MVHCDRSLACAIRRPVDICMRLCRIIATKYMCLCEFDWSELVDCRNDSLIIICYQLEHFTDSETIKIVLGD